MKNLAVPLLLLAVAAGQAIRIETAYADEPEIPAAEKPTVAETRAVAVAKWRAEPYRIEPPDILSIEMKWDDSYAAKEKGSRLKNPKVRCLYKDQFLVEPDGVINIDGIARIDVAGKTVDEVAKLITDKFPKHFGVPRVKVEVAIFNSKVVFVIEERPSGDIVARIHCTKTTNVLDALASLAKKVDIEDEVHIMWPVGHTGRPNKRLEVDLEAILSLTTNYALLPGDRIFVVFNKKTDSEHGSSKSISELANSILPNPVPSPPRYYSPPPADDEKEPAPLTVGSFLVITLEGDTARHLIPPIKGMNRPTPGLRLQIVARVVDIKSNGNLIVKTTGNFKLDGRTLQRSISGIVRPEDVGPNNHVKSEDIASLEIVMSETDTR